MTSWKLSGIAAVAIAAGVVWWYQQSSGVPEAGASNADSAAAAPGRGNRRGRGDSLVVVQPVTEAIINDRLKAVGNGKALASVSVVPLSSGLLSDVLVQSGQQVNKGEVLARLDDEEQLIARDRAARTAENAAVEEARLAKLYRSRTVTEADLISSRADLADAKLALREAEVTLARRNITAPISGIVGLVEVNAGNYVTNQTEIVTIDNRSTIIMEFWVPERFASQITIGQKIEATAQANPSQIHIGKVTGIGSRVESDSRTLPVEAQLNNEQDNLRPGMSFNLTLSFTGQTYPAVNPLAIQWDSTGAYVWRINDKKAERVPVQIMQRNPESVLIASELQVDDQVVTEGLLSLRPGASVRIDGERPAGSGASAPNKPGSKPNDRQNGKAGTEDKPAAQVANP